MAIENTSKRMNDRLSQGDITAMFEGTPEAIYASEARGQQQLLASTTLPTDMMGGKEAFEAVGFVFGEVVKDDPMFTEVTLPEGWTREGTGHSMWSNVLDERGIERVAVFYKAAFYDRSAHMSLVNVPMKLVDAYVWSDEGDPGYQPLSAESLRWEILTPGERLDMKGYVLKMLEKQDDPDAYHQPPERAAKLQEVFDLLCTLTA